MGHREPAEDAARGIAMLGMLFLGFVLGTASALFLCEIWFSARGGRPPDARDQAGYR